MANAGARMPNNNRNAGSVGPIAISYISEGIVWERDGLLYTRVGPTETSISFRIKNVAENRVIFEGYNCTWRSCILEVRCEDEHSLSSGGSLHVLEPGEIYEIRIVLVAPTNQECASAQVRLRLNFNIGGADQSLMVKKFIVCHMIPPHHERLFNELSEPKHQRREEWSAPDDDDDYWLEIVWLDRQFQFESALDCTLVPIDDYRVGKDMRLNQLLKLKLTTWSDYQEFFHKLLYLEELQMEKDIKTYTIRSTFLRRADRGRGGEMRFKLDVPGLLEKRPSVLKGDRIFAKPLIAKPKFKYEGQVDYIAQKTIFVFFHEQ